MEKELFQIKKRVYQVIKKLPADYSLDDGYLVSFEDKQYLLVEMKDDEEVDRYFRYKVLMKNYKNLKRSSISVPKLIDEDNNQTIYVREYIEGETVLMRLVKEDLDDKMFEKIFDIAFFARSMNILVNFFPSNFIIDDKENLIYNSYQTRPYEKDDAFEWNAIRYWVYTPELVSYLKSVNLPYDQRRVQNANVLNKKIVLLVCAYRK